MRLHRSERRAEARAVGLAGQQVDEPAERVGSSRSEAAKCRPPRPSPAETMTQNPHGRMFPIASAKKLERSPRAQPRHTRDLTASLRSAPTSRWPETHPLDPWSSPRLPLP